MLCFGHKIRWCFALADARNDVVFCRCGCIRILAMQLVRVLLNFSRVLKVTLGPFVGFLCYVLGTKLGDVSLLRMREMM